MKTIIGNIKIISDMILVHKIVPIGHLASLTAFLWFSKNTV